MPKDREAPKNYKPAMLEKCRRRRADLASGFREAAFALLEEHAKEVTQADLDRAYRAVLEVDPDDKIVRGILQEVPRGGEWVLFETQSSADVRAVWNAALSKSAKDAPKTTRAEPSESETALGIDWMTRLDNGDFRVLAMVDRTEAHDVLLAGHVARELFRGIAQDSAIELATGYTIYLVPDAVSRNAIISKHPVLGGSDYGSRQGTRIGETQDMVRWDRMRDARLESSTRHTVTLFLEEGFGLSGKNGWAYEGLRHYVAHRLLSTRTRSFVEKLEREPAGNASADAPPREDDWRAKSLTLLTGKGARDVARLFVLQSDEMQTEDVTLACALAAFLVEGRPRKAPELLRRIAQDGRSDAAFEELLGFDAAQLNGRLIRWLEERD